MSFFKNKKVLVTGGTGLIGRPLLDLLENEGANITVVSLDEPKEISEKIFFKRVDLREFNNCLDICKGKEIVFHLAGVKGSPAVTATRPASFFVPTILFNTNMMEAARRNHVERFLYTSSIGVYSPKSEVFYEDDVWETFPSENDKFAGWAKRMGELQAQAYLREYNWENISIVRPANVYGPYDNFDSNNAMVIPSLIKKISDNRKKTLSVWGDGSSVRDFIHAKDVARGMMQVIEAGYNKPINLGSGQGVTIREIAEIISENGPNGPIDIKWDTSKPQGDQKRLMDVSRAKEKIGFEAKINIKSGILETMNWFFNTSKSVGKRYNSFTEKVHLPKID